MGGGVTFSSPRAKWGGRFRGRIETISSSVVAMRLAVLSAGVLLCFAGGAAKQGSLGRARAPLPLRKMAATP